MTGTTASASPPAPAGPAAGLGPGLVGRSFAPTAPYLVTEERVGALVRATGGTYAGGPAPATFPIVVAFEAMFGFLDEVGVALERVVHGQQDFHYRRPVVPGDVLVATLTVASVRSIGGSDLVGIRSTVTDADGAEVCTASSTLVHRAAEVVA